MPATKHEILEAKRLESFCKTVLARNSRKVDRIFEEGQHGILRRRHSQEDDILQILLHGSLRPRLLTLAHHYRLGEQPDQKRMYNRLRVVYYWPHMVADVAARVHACVPCANKWVRLRKRTAPRQLFPTDGPLSSLEMVILGPLTKDYQGLSIYFGNS